MNEDIDTMTHDCEINYDKAEKTRKIYFVVTGNVLRKGIEEKREMLGNMDTVKSQVG